MVTTRRAARTKTDAGIYQVEVVLTGSSPSIWRRVQVPGSANLGWLHAVIQLAMGWTNSHLHQFRLGDRTYSDPSFEMNEFEDDPKVLDENQVVLMQILPREGDVFVYDYDFGDSWQHRVTVEQILPPDAVLAKTARCVGGARACPPEDCGGLPGYEELLRVMKNPKHKEHESMKEWLGRPFAPAAFDLEAANACLRRLKWPRVTEDQLATVLMARDGY